MSARCASAWRFSRRRESSRRFAARAAKAPPGSNACNQAREPVRFRADKATDPGVHDPIVAVKRRHFPFADSAKGKRVSYV